MEKKGLSEQLYGTMSENGFIDSWLYLLGYPELETFNTFVDKNA